MQGRFSRRNKQRSRTEHRKDRLPTGRQSHKESQDTARPKDDRVQGTHTDKAGQDPKGSGRWERQDAERTRSGTHCGRRSHTARKDITQMEKKMDPEDGEGRNRDHSLRTGGTTGKEEKRNLKDEKEEDKDQACRQGDITPEENGGEELEDEEEDYGTTQGPTSPVGEENKDRARQQGDVTPEENGVDLEDEEDD